MRSPTAFPDAAAGGRWRIDGERPWRSWPVAGVIAAAAALVAAQVWISVVGSREPLGLLAAILYVVAFVVSFRNTMSGLALVIVGQVRVLQGTEGIILEEIAYAGLFFATVAGWFLRRGSSVDGGHVLRSRLGRTILLFLAFCLVSIVQTLLFKGEAEWWFRDFIRFSYLLLFFPVAGVVRTKRDAVTLLTCFLLVIGFHAFVAIFWYQEAVAAATLQQVRYMRVPFHEIFATSTFVVAFAFFLHARSKRALALSMLVGLVGALTLAVSLSRSYWVAAVLALLLVFVFSERRPGRALAFVALLVLLFAGIGFAAFGSKMIEVVSSLSERASTIGAPLRALSMLERGAESSAWLERVPGSPIIGHGLGAHASYMSPIHGYVVTRTFAHNAYLFLLFKLGIAGTIFFFAWYLTGVGVTWRAMRRARGPYERAAMAGGLSLLLAFIPLSVTYPQYYERASMLVIVLIVGVAQAFLLRDAAPRREAAPDRASAPSAPDGGGDAPT